MLKDYRNELMFQSLKDTIPATKCKAGGMTKEHQVIRSDQSRNYGGAVNIANNLRAEADYIRRTELIPLETMVYAKQREQITKGKGSRIPAKYHKAINAIKSRISALKKEANTMVGIGNNVAHDFQKPQPKYVGLTKSR
jgi:hypothetical protein